MTLKKSIIVLALVGITLSSRNSFSCPSTEVNLEFPTVDGQGTTREFSKYIISVRAWPEGKIEIRLSDETTYLLNFEQTGIYKNYGATPGWCVEANNQQQTERACIEGTDAYHPSLEDYLFTPLYPDTKQFKGQFFKEKGLLSGLISGHVNDETLYNPVLYLKNKQGFVVGMVDIDSRTAQTIGNSRKFPQPGIEGTYITLIGLTKPTPILNYKTGYALRFNYKKQISLLVDGFYEFSNYLVPDRKQGDLQEELNASETQEIVNNKEKQLHPNYGIKHSFVLKLRHAIGNQYPELLGSVTLHRLFSNRSSSSAEKTKSWNIPLTEKREWSTQLGEHCEINLTSGLPWNQ